MCTVALTIASALGSIWQGYTQKQAADAQAQAMEINAKIADQQAHDAVVRGGLEEQKMRRQLRLMLGQQTANVGASGVLADNGSALDARLSSVDAMERDIDINEANAQRERWGHQVEAVNYRNQASAAKASGRNAMTAGIFGAGSTMLGLVAPKVDNWWSKGAKVGTGTDAALDVAAYTPNHYGMPYLPPGMDDLGSWYSYPTGKNGGKRYWRGGR